MNPARTLASPRPERLWLRIALPFLAGYFISYLYRAANAVLGPALAVEFGLSPSGLGLMTGAYFFAFAAFQLPAGLLLDRYGPRRVNASLLLVAAAGAVWFATARSEASLVAARALIGAGVAVCLMSSFQAFALWYPPERLATLNASGFTAGALGAITATVPLELALRVLPWRGLFLGVAAVTVAASLVLFLWVPERRASHRPEPLAAQLRRLASVARDAGFWRIALGIAGSQLAAISLVTLWIATWLRDVAGYGPGEVAAGLLAVNVALIAGYVGFGRAADAAVRAGRDPVVLLLGGLAGASICLGLIVLGLRAGSLLVWCAFAAAASASSLSYSILLRRYPRTMAGRVNTALNVVVFLGVFLGQWGVGLVLNRFPGRVRGYAPGAYTWALAVLWAAQLAGLFWLWRGRKLFAAPA